MKIEINKLTDEYFLKITSKENIEIVYIKDLECLFEYILGNILWHLEKKSRFLNGESFAKINIDYEEKIK